MSIYFFKNKTKKLSTKNIKTENKPKNKLIRYIIEKIQNLLIKNIQKIFLNIELVRFLYEIF